MQTVWIRLTGVLLILSAGASVGLGQIQGPGPLPTGQPPLLPPGPGAAGNKNLRQPPNPSLREPADLTSKKVHDLNRLAPLQRQVYLAAQRGTEWLQRANKADGRFFPGLIPALRVPLEGDHYLHQVAATVALGRAAQLFQDERPAAIARQALLTLLLETEKDPAQPTVRRPALLPGSINRLAAAGWLVLAIHELPAPGSDLLEQAEELCNFIRQQQRTDGALIIKTSGASGQADDGPADAASAGVALYALVRSQRHKAAAWKQESVRKGRDFYLARWRENKEAVAASWLTAACAEMYLLVKEQTCADAVHELSEWLCSLQYHQLDPRRALWLGGFQSWQQGKTVPTPPEVHGAVYLEGLCQACRVAKQLGELQRYQRYHSTVERGLQFLTTLQYTEASTQHFAEWYRPAIVGAFHASHQDGNLRLDYTQQAVCAMLNYLLNVAEVRP